MINSRVANLGQLQSLATEGSLFALLDACDEPAVREHCAFMTEERAVCLYNGRAKEEWANLAPYLAHLKSSDIDWISKNLWRAPWGYFVIARTDLTTLRTHFRRFLVTRLPDGREMLFRFYDPRVLKTFLESSDQAEINQFYGPAQAFGVASAGKPETLSMWFA